MTLILPIEIFSITPIVVRRGNRTIRKILKPTDSHICLRRRTTIGVIEKISIDSINVINDPNPEIETDRLQPESTYTLAEQLEVIKSKGIVLEQNDLPREQYETLINLIFTNIDLFATGMHDLVGTDIVKMEIDTGNARPVRKRPYRQSPEMQREMERQVQEMVSAGIVEPSDSPWSSPCLLIKRSGTNEYRFVNDYERSINLRHPCSGQCRQ